MGTQPRRRAPPDRLHCPETHIHPEESRHAQKSAKFPAANCLAAGTVPLAWQTAYLQRWAQTHPQTAILSAAAGNGARWIAAAFAALLLTSTRTPGRRIALVGTTTADARAMLARVGALIPRGRAHWWRSSRGNAAGEAFIENRVTLTRLDALSSRSGRSIDGSVVIGIAPAEWPVNAATRILTAAASCPHVLLVGQQPARAGHPFAVALGDPSAARTLHAAGPDADPFDPMTWSAANPAIRDFPELADAIRREAERAQTSPLALVGFREARLNLGANAAGAGVLCKPADLERCETTDIPAAAGSLYLGVDLGSSASLTAAVAYWPETGRMQVFAAAPDTPSLDERGRLDGVGNLYAEAAHRGELDTHPGRTVDVVRFLSDVLDALPGEPCVIGADRHRRAEFLTALTQTDYRGPVALRGTGASAVADGSHDVRSFQRAVLEVRIAVQPGLLLASALAGVHLASDGNNNPKLDKTRSRARIDVAQAAVIATGLAAIGKTTRGGVVYHGATSAQVH